MSRRVWIGGLNNRVERVDIRDAFSLFGDIKELSIRSSRKDVFAFITFSTESSAKEAIAKMDQRRVAGTKVKVAWAEGAARPKRERSPRARVRERSPNRPRRSPPPRRQRAEESPDSRRKAIEARKRNRDPNSRPIREPRSPPVARPPTPPREFKGRIPSPRSVNDEACRTNQYNDEIFKDKDKVEPRDSRREYKSNNDAIDTAPLRGDSRERIDTNSQGLYSKKGDIDASLRLDERNSYENDRKQDDFVNTRRSAILPQEQDRRDNEKRSPHESFNRRRSRIRSIDRTGTPDARRRIGTPEDNRKDGRRRSTESKSHDRREIFRRDDRDRVENRNRWRNDRESHRGERTMDNRSAARYSDRGDERRGRNEDVRNGIKKRRILRRPERQNNRRDDRRDDRISERRDERRENRIGDRRFGERRDDRRGDNRDERRNGRRDDRREGRRDDRRTEERRDERRPGGRLDRGRLRRESNVPKGKYKIRIENIPAAMTWQELKELGLKYGKSVTFSRTFRSGSTPSGLVEYSDKDDAENALNDMHGILIEGRKIDTFWEEGRK